ncbi:MAG: hypothetical protein ABR579_07565 [Actinomycetota bacterium]
MRGRKLLIFAGVIVSILCLGGVAQARPPYPASPPNFAHPGSPYNGDDVYSPVGGDLDRDLVVVLMNFTDVSIPASRDAAFYSNQIFGSGFGTLRDYFLKNSFGKFVVSPAKETDTSNNGATNDGIVTVNAGETLAAFNARTDQSRSRLVIDKADPSINYASYDTNNDGNVTDKELGILYIRAAQPTTTNSDNCGATRGEDSGTNDGKNVVVRIAGGTSATDLITHIHEIGHSMLHMRDMYGFGPGSFDITGPTCGYNDSTFFGINAWQKMNWGWINPTVVTADGYYNVQRADSNPQAFILYDTSKGTQNYFIVENRQQPANTYDQNTQDNGLVIWRIDESQYNSSNNNVRPMEIMRADGATATGPVQCNASDPPPGSCFSSGADGDAWDAGDTNFPQRTMSRPWRDGSASNVAVRAIGRSGATMRAYFDVRGPGVLVDPTVQSGGDEGRPIQVNVTPEESNPVTFPVVNTGEATDSFNFNVGSLPGGWSATTDNRSLGASAGAVASINVTPDANAPTGPVNVQAVGTSTSDNTVTSSLGFTLNVVLDRTNLDYTGDDSVPYGEPAAFAATVTDPDDPGTPPVANIPVTFSLSNGTDTQSTTANSGSDGVASANPTLTVPPGNYTLTVSSPRVGKHDAKSITLPYTVERRPTILTYNGETTKDYSDPASVSAILTDGINGSPLSGKSIDFTLGSQSTSGATSSGTGTATGTIVINQPSGSYSVGSSFAGDSIYLPSSDSDPFTITKEKLSFSYTGDTLTSMTSTPTLTAQATEESDGSPGDLALAEAHFRLNPTLTTTPYDYVTSVSNGGVASTPATSLPVDLWTIDISVPSSNQYWQGNTSNAAELVVFDPNAHITGAGSGLDSGGQRAQVNLEGKYKADSPTGNVKVQSAGGNFTGSGFDWIVQVGNKAIFQVEGAVGLQSATLRLRLLDAGEPSRSDTFRAVETGLLGPLYDSGVVALDRGNLQTH